VEVLLNAQYIIIALISILIIVLLILMYNIICTDKNEYHKKVFDKKTDNDIYNISRDNDSGRLYRGTYVINDKNKVDDVRMLQENDRCKSKINSSKRRTHKDKKRHTIDNLKITHQHTQNIRDRLSISKQLTPVEELVDDYNQAVHKLSASEFKQKYRNRLRIGVQNTEDRLIEQDVKPIFIDHDAGNYWGIEISNKLLVVPRLELTFIESHNGPGGMNYVFSYDGFNASLKYTGLTVLKPAVFDRTDAGYCLREPGTLKLGQGVER